MRTSIALALFLFACGGPKTKKESALVNEGDTPATCCCKTIPQTAEKEIVPAYAMSERMECSTQHGDCVDDIQCNASNSSGPTETTNGGTSGDPPPPPQL
jgi:hypothetical protein